MNNTHFKIHGIMVGKERIENLPVYKAVKRHAIGTGVNNSNLDFSIIKKFQALATLFIYKINYGYNSLKNMKALKTLTINACSIKDFTVLKDTNVNTLSLGLMSNSDLSSLKGHEKLTVWNYSG